MYIETVILNNFVLTYVSASLSCYCLSKRVCVWRNILASTLGTVVAVFYPFINVNQIVLNLIKLALAIAISFILFFKSAKAIPSAILFLGITFCLGGSCFAVGFIIYGNTISAERLASNFPLYIALIIGVIVFYVFKFAYRIIRFKLLSIPFIYNCELTVFNQCVKMVGFLDTGNNAFDNKSGLPIVICSLKTLLKKLNHEGSIKLLQSLSHNKRASIKTAGGKSSLILLKPSSLRLYLPNDKHRLLDVMVGVVSTEFNEKFDLILNPSLR